MPEYKSWPKIANLTDKVTVTEKIDGAGAFAIHIERLKFDVTTGELAVRPGDVIDFSKGDMTFFRLTAQSRTRLITPKDDNYGFAKWVAANASGLAGNLGEGIHYGEWWGYKINRGYGLAKGDKRFSLYNTERWGYLDGSQVPGLWCVPVLDRGELFEEIPRASFAHIFSPVHYAIDVLRTSGSMAAPGYDRPEGVVVFHTGGRVMFKYKLDTPFEEEEYAAKHNLVSPVTYEPIRSREEQDADLTAMENGTYRGYGKPYADVVKDIQANTGVSYTSVPDAKFIDREYAKSVQTVRDAFYGN